MATAIIPIVQTLVPVLMPIASDLIKKAESWFGKKSGPLKFDAVAKSLQAVADSLSKQGIISPPTEDQIHTIIETLVQQMKSTGQLSAIDPNLPITGNFKIIGVVNIIPYSIDKGSNS